MGVPLTTNLKILDFFVRTATVKHQHMVGENKRLTIAVKNAIEKLKVGLIYVLHVLMKNGEK